MNRVTVPARQLNRLAETIPGLLKSFKMHTGSELVSLPRNGSEQHSQSIFLLFVARKGTSSCVLFHGMVRNGIRRICIYYGSTERKSELCSLPQKGSEQNYESLIYFLSTEWKSQLLHPF